MSEIKKVQLVRTGPAQTVEIPPEFAMPGNTVLIVEPARELGLLEWLATLDPIEEEFPDVDEGLLPLCDFDL